MTTPVAARSKRTTASHISQELRRMAGDSLNALGGIAYLKRIAESDPQAYLQFVAKCIKTDDGAEAAGITFVVQQLVIGNQPVPGVHNSPLQQHVMPLRLAAKGGDVIDT